MSKRIILTSLLLVCLMVSRAQGKLTYAEADRQSYQLYLDGKWGELIKYASEARKQDIDFFYLQARTGIAWYRLERFGKASTWFAKAYETDPSMDWLQEYVYYSLLLSGQQQEAEKYSLHFSEAVKNKTGYYNHGITRLAFETGYSFNTNYKELKTRSFSTETNLGEDYGEGYFLKNDQFQSFDLSHRIGHHLQLNHNLTYVGVNREALVDWGGQTNSNIRINQFNYYINPVFIIGKKLNISPSLSLLFGSGDVYAGGFNSNALKTFSLSKTSYNDAVLSTSIWTSFAMFSPGIEVNAGDINDSQFTQLSSWVTWYPLSNLHLYITPRIYFKSAGDGLAWNAMGISGGTYYRQVHFYGQYLWGHMENFVESSGYLISNFPGESQRKLMGSVYFPLYKKYQLVIRYIHQDRSEDYQVYTGGSKSRSLEYNYSKQTITGGISWIF